MISLFITLEMIEAYNSVTWRHSVMPQNPHIVVPRKTLTYNRHAIGYRKQRNISLRLNKYTRMEDER